MLDPVRNQEAKDIVGIQEIIVDEDKNYLQILFAPESPVSESNLQLVKDLIEKESLLKGGVVFEAIKDVFIESESNSLIITMVDPETPKLKEVRKGHFVSCLLYDYNYFDQETSGSEQVAEELISDKG
jgi:peptide/nickel transport system ATP-binding protein